MCPFIKKSCFRLAVLIFISAVGYSCTKDSARDNHPVAYWETPVHFPSPHYSYSGNNKSAEIFELGRALFYDPILSLDSTISCASCHHQHLAFSDSIRFSAGVKDRLGRRNSPPLFNLAWNTSFMWDGGINHIEVMSIAPITDSFEMALPLRVVGSRLNNTPRYQKAFKSAMKTDSITDRQFLLALTQFMGALISSDSPYDSYVKGQSQSLSSDALEGLKLFRVHCGDCHKEPLFTDYSFRNNGTYSVGGDSGRFLISDNVHDLGRFKVPSLRNIKLTAPYMHDGRFETLEEVIEHYTSSLSDREGIDPILKGRIELTATEKNQIISFLKSLTDPAFIQQTAFTNPHVN